MQELVRRGDEIYARFKPHEALKEFLKALELNPKHHEALCKAARAAIDIGDMIPETEPHWEKKRLPHYLAAEQYARKAVAADSNSTWGYFYVAASLGKIATVSPIAKQIDLAPEIRENVERALALDPRNGYAYHIYGVWHRRVAEIGQMSRLLASVLLGRSVPQGSLERSEEYLKEAVSLNPTVIVHRLELAKTSIALGKFEQAKGLLQSVSGLPIRFSDDSEHKQSAKRLLEEIRDR